MPSPNLLFRDDAFELRDPVFTDLVLVKDPVADVVFPSRSSCLEGSCVLSVIARKWPSNLLTIKQTVIIIDQTVKKSYIFMGITVKYQSFSKAGNESTAISVVPRSVKETLKMVSPQDIYSQGRTHSERSFIVAPKALLFCGDMSSNDRLNCCENTAGFPESKPQRQSATESAF